MKTNWPTKKLGEVTYFQEGPGLRTFQFKSTGIRVINVANVREGFLDLSKTKFLDTTEVEQKYKHFLVNKNDILVSTSGTIGRVAWVEKENLPLMLNTSVVRFHTLDEKSLLNRFLFYFLSGSSFRNELLKYKTGVAIFNVGPSHLKKIKISLPPLAIQKQIVERLDKIAEAQKLNDELIQKADELYRSLLHNELNAKFKNQNAKSQFKMQKLKDVAEILGGFAFKSGSLINEEIAEGYLPVIKIGNVLKNGDLDTLNVQYHKFDNSLEKYVIHSGDILVAMTGATVGKVVSSPVNNLLLNQRVGLIRAHSEMVDQDFLGIVLRTKRFYEYCQNTAGGGAQGNISPSQIMDYEIELPPLKIQKRIVEKLSAAQEYKNQLLAQKSKLKELFDSVLNKSFKGKLVK